TYRFLAILRIECTLSSRCTETWLGCMKRKAIKKDGLNKIGYMAIQAPDLTKQPPRSPRVRLGGYAILPRCLDKGRATINGKNGEYHYACPLDQQFLEFAGIDPEALKKELAKSDTEVLEWIK